jgi:hypothetical protein
MGGRNYVESVESERYNDGKNPAVTSTRALRARTVSVASLLLVSVVPFSHGFKAWGVNDPIHAGLGPIHKDELANFLQTAAKDSHHVATRMTLLLHNNKLIDY